MQVDDCIHIGGSEYVGNEYPSRGDDGGPNVALWGQPPFLDGCEKTAVCMRLCL